MQWQSEGGATDRAARGRGAGTRDRRRRHLQRRVVSGRTRILNSIRHTGQHRRNAESERANYTGEALYERQAVRDGNVVTANGTGQLEFTRECLLALAADTPEALIAASYKFNKEGFYSK